jgi:hypothetical protein
VRSINLLAENIFLANRTYGGGGGYCTRVQYTFWFASTNTLIYTA